MVCRHVNDVFIELSDDSIWRERQIGCVLILVFGTLKKITIDVIKQNLSSLLSSAGVIAPLGVASPAELAALGIL